LSERELQTLFLQARNVWLTKALMISTADPHAFLSETIELSRRHIFSIVTQYKVRHRRE
jgi:hypothetical protein